jgi:hypothetical protein
MKITFSMKATGSDEEPVAFCLLRLGKPRVIFGLFPLRRLRLGDHTIGFSARIIAEVIVHPAGCAGS